MAFSLEQGNCFLGPIYTKVTTGPKRGADFLKVPTILVTAFLIICLLLINTAVAAQKLVLDDSAENYILGGPFLDVLEDKTGRLTINEASSLPLTSSYTQLNQPVPNFGMTDSAFWFRFSIESKTSQPRDWLLLLDNPLIDEVDLYVPRGDGAFDVETSGDTRPLGSRAIPGKDICLPLPVGTASQIFYLRVWVPGRAIFPISALTQNAYHRMASIQDGLIWGYAGFLLAISLLGLFLYLLLKDRVYLLYMVYTLGVLLSMLIINGHLGVPISREHPWFHHYFKALIWSIPILAGAAFTRSFLKTKEHLPRLDLLLKWFVMFYLLFMAACPFIPPLIGKQLLNVGFLAASLFAIAAAMACYRQGYGAALHFLYSRCFIYIGAIVFSLVNMGILPLNLFTKNIYLLTTAFDVVFISLALGDNFVEMTRRISTLLRDLKSEVVERTTANLALEEQIAQRKKLEREIVKISDKERRSISQELHDGLCQQLTGARLRFAALEDRFKKAGIEPEAKSLGLLLDESVNHAYQLSKGLWSMDSGGKGAMINLQDVVSQQAEQSGLQISLEQSKGCSSCGSESLTQVHYIAREAIFNAVKHSEATLVSVRLQCDQEKGITLKVIDNGRGLDGGVGNGKGGMGIRIMMHRSEMIGGALWIGQADGRGTRVVCTAPCRPE
ncbi:MAG: 7TM-DISM domain-containing protein [Pseudomonadota bacterium]